MLTLNDGRSELWQWDTGRTLAVDADCSQVHFSNKVFGRSVDVDVVGGVAIIPDILLQTDKDLNVWAFVGTAENGYTKISKTFKVNRRNKPADYVFTPQEQILLKDATAILEEAKDVANGAMETAKKAEASADKAAQIADEMKKMSAQVEQNTETATKAKADALTAQAKAEEARNAAEIAKKAAEEAANSAGTDASAASAAATRAQNAANDAAATMDSIRVLYQEMQEYVSQSVQDIQTEGNTQVQRVADEGTAQTAAAKEQADRAKAEADRAEAARAKAEEVVESCIPDDTAVDGKPWTSKKTVDSLCMPFEENGNPVQCYPVENYPLCVKVSWEPTQEGEGDPSPENIRPIKGRDSVTVERCGENLLNPKKNVYFTFTPYGLTITYIGDNKVHLKGTYNSGFGGGYFVILDTNQKLLAGRNLKITGFTIEGTKQTYRLYGLRKKDETYIAMNAKFADGDVIDMTVAIVVSKDTPTTYTPYIGQTITMTLPETVYGGEVDAVSGEGLETWKMLTLDGTERWADNGNIASKKQQQWALYNILAPYSGTFGISSHFGNTKSPSKYPFNFVRIASTSIVLHVALDGPFATVDDLKSYLAAQYAAGTPVQICYKLAEPVPFTATGTQPIPALSGVNTIYTDVDGVVVTGAEDPKHTITELKNAIISLGGNV